MPEEANFDPLQDAPRGEKLGGNRVSVDNQTDIDSSLYAEGVRSDIAKGDEKLGKEINQVQSNQKQMHEELNSSISSNKKAIDAVAKDAAQGREDLADTILFNAGDENAELTPSGIADLITEFKEEMAQYIATVKDENSTEKQIRIATFWLNQFGEVYTPLGFNLWQLKDFSSVADDLDSATMDEYEDVIEKIRKEIVSIQENIASLKSEGDLDDEGQDKLEMYEGNLKTISENFVRWTDPSDATPDLIETRVATLEKGLQWRFDTEDDRFEAFENNLNRNVLGTTSAGEYYTAMKTSFEEEATNAKDVIAQHAAMEKAGEPISDDFEVRFKKAEYFLNTFGTIPSLIAVTSFEDYKDAYRAVQWSPETYGEYENAVEDLQMIVEKLSQEISTLQSIPVEEQEPDYADRLSRAKDNKKDAERSLFEITCEDALSNGGRIKCLDGYVYWYVTKHDNEMDKFVTSLHSDVLGTSTAGEYYRAMKNAFEEEATNAKDVIAQHAAMEKAGEPISQDFEVRFKKAEYFLNTFGTIASIIAVTSFEDYKDSYRAVQWNPETYGEYENAVEDLQMIVEKLSQEISTLQSIPVEEQGPNYGDQVSRAKDNKKDAERSLFEITCEDPLSNGGRIKCLDGYVYWYVTKHDNEMESFVSNLHSNVLGTSTAGEYYTAMKNAFEEEATNAKDVIAQHAAMEKAGEPISDDFEVRFKKAEYFVNTFGTIPSIIAVTSFEDYKDGYRAVQWSPETYGSYENAVEDLEMMFEKASQELSTLGSIPAEEQGPDHADRLSEAKDNKDDAERKLFEITCEDPLSNGGRIKCLDGYVYWYVTTHNDEFERYITSAREENGFNPSVQVDYLSEKKSQFEAEMDAAIKLIKASEQEGGEPVDERQLSEAQEFVSRFGKISNSQTAFHNWLAYNAEERVSDAVGEIFRIVECANEAIVNGVNNIETTSTEVASYYPLPDGNTADFKLVGVPTNYQVTQVFVNGIATTFAAGFEEDTITLLPQPHAGANLTVLIEVKSNPSISVPLVDNCDINLPDEISEYSIFTCDREERRWLDLGRNISSGKETIAELEHKIEKATRAKLNLEELEAELVSEQKELDAKIAQASKEVADKTASMEKAQEDVSVLEGDLAAGEDTVNQLHQEVRDYENQIDANQAQIAIHKVSKEAEEARPFPSEEVIAKLTKAIQDLEKATKEAEDAMQATEAQLAKTESQNDKISDELDAAREDLSTLTADVDALNASISRSNARLKLVVTNNLHAQVNIKNQTARIDKETEKKSDLQSQIASFEKERKDVAEKASEAGCSFEGGKK